MFTLQRILYLSGWGVALGMAIAVGIYRQENIFKELGIATFGYWATVLFLDSLIDDE